MKVVELDIVQWSELMKMFQHFDRVDKSQCPPAMRCENSQLTLGWKMGGFTMNGHTYTAFCPRAVHGPCAMLAVRDDFLRWVTKQLKDEEKKNKPAKQTCQQELF